MICEPALGLVPVLAALEGVIYDQGEIVTRSLLVPERVEIVLLDEEHALLISCAGVISQSVSQRRTGNVGCWLICSMRTLVFVVEGD